jgi:hypothetical protein
VTASRNLEVKASSNARRRAICDFFEYLFKFSVMLAVTDERVAAVVVRRSGT